MARRCSSNDSREIGVQRDIKGHGTAMLVLGLNVLDATVAYMLWSKANGMFATARSVQDYRHRKARLCSDWMPLLVSFDFLQGPRMEAVGPVVNFSYVPRRVMRRFIGLDRPTEQSAQSFEPNICSSWRINPFIA